MRDSSSKLDLLLPASWLSTSSKDFQQHSVFTMHRTLENSKQIELASTCASVRSRRNSREGIQMRLLMTRSYGQILASLGILLSMALTGCGMPAHIRNLHRNKSGCEQLYGVDGGSCHGYQPTCWRQWDCERCPAACGPMGHASLACPEIPEEAVKSEFVDQEL